MKNADINKYIRNIKLLLPLHTKKEKRFLNDMQDSIQLFFSNSSVITYETITNQFGTPEQVVCDYISAQDSNQLLVKLQTTHIVKRFCFYALLILILGYFVFWTEMRKEIISMTPVEVEETIDIIESD
jgi:hypothetical protein